MRAYFPICSERDELEKSFEGENSKGVDEAGAAAVADSESEEATGEGEQQPTTEASLLGPTPKQALAPQLVISPYSLEFSMPNMHFLFSKYWPMVARPDGSFGIHHSAPTVSLPSYFVSIGLLWSDSDKRELFLSLYLPTYGFYQQAKDS